MSIDAVNTHGETVLHLAIRRGYLDTVRFFLTHGCNTSLRDRDGLDVIQKAAVHRQTQTLEYLLEELKATAKIRADAYSLIGASFADEPIDTQRALSYWRKAADVRTKELTTHSAAVEGPNPVPTNSNALEAVDFASLAQILGNDDAIFIQALVIQVRIFGPRSSRTLQTWRKLYERVSCYVRWGEYQRAIDMTMCAMSMTPTKKDAYQTSHARCLDLASDAIWEMLYEGATRPSFLDVSDVLSLIVSDIKWRDTMRCKIRVRLPSCDTQVDVKLLLPQPCIRMVHVLGRLMTTEDERSSVRWHVRAVVHTGYRAVTNGDSLLHIAVREASSLFSDTRVPHMSSRVVVELLLEAGAPVNAVNREGDTPLHLAVFNQPATMRGDDKDWSEVIDALLEHGAHIDKPNKAGKTAQDFLPADVVFKHTRLECLAARAIRASKLPYRGILPTMLADFVDEH